MNLDEAMEVPDDGTSCEDKIKVGVYKSEEAPDVFNEAVDEEVHIPNVAYGGSKLIESSIVDVPLSSPQLVELAD